eukprot:3932181-Rhodomonas_salina.3
MHAKICSPIESDDSVFIKQDSSPAHHPSTDTYSEIVRKRRLSTYLVAVESNQSARNTQLNRIVGLSPRTSRREYNKKVGLQLQDSVRKAMHDSLSRGLSGAWSERDVEPLACLEMEDLMISVDNKKMMKNENQKEI